MEFAWNSRSNIVTDFPNHVWYVSELCSEVSQVWMTISQDEDQNANKAKGKDSDKKVRQNERLIWRT